MSDEPRDNIDSRLKKSISKELLSKVLGFECRDLSPSKGNKNYLNYYGAIEIDKWTEKSINIYELAHRCKEWARDNSFINIMTYKKGPYYFVEDNDFLDNEDFKSDSEPEAIFKACQWILDKDKS